MSIQHFAIKNRGQWLDLRKQDVTASVVGALLGVHEWATPYSIWAEKTGRLPERREETPAQRRGRILQGVAFEILAEERPEWRIERGTRYYREPETRLGATPDLLVKHGRKRGIVQVKTVEASVFRSKWVSQDGEIDVPLWIAVQAIVEATLTGSDFAYVAALVVGHGVDLHVEEVPIHSGIMDRVRAEVAEFWRMVEAGEEPSPDYRRDAETLSSVYRESHGTEIDLSDDLLFRALVERRHELKAEISDRTSELEDLDARLVHRIGPFERVHLPGWHVSRPEVTRRDRIFGTKTTHRQLRIRPEEPRS